MSTPFKVDLADIEFTFFDQLKVAETLGKTESYAEIDHDTYKTTLIEAARLAVEVMHPVNAPGDREGCSLDGEGNVTTPKGYGAVWRAMVEGGWIAPSAPVEFGGVGMPRVVAMTVADMFVGACTAFMMYPGLTSAAARMIDAFYTHDERELLATKLFTGDWGGTMCLTESGAGSSVGDNRAKAVPADDESGVFLLEGEKIFISGGDSDMVENIIHLVLARTPDAPPGVKGISLFIVPKFLPDVDGDGDSDGDAAEDKR